MFGLLNRDIEYIKDAILKFETIEKVIIFGSRAMGNYKKGSDVDMAIFGKDITKEVIFQLDDYLNEVLPLPYFFDILHYENISNDNLKKHINDEGRILFERMSEK
ncbi:nucleotidyltransferase domain-containing protein [Clostridium sp. CS001]|uniref:nucleotidyltransferase family protein n=1 Tax=Clostridium sp. CS001 TaxID=2880648 RepID=UPI001CF287DB|nr:nucleotidyltransferase domain-containing protein [Clostridium sp. CS001]MCB2290659.1 nucleotidyltransferase domain-containing protein [Clostridium sp. CS001]